MSWRGQGRGGWSGPWPGKGPFSNLPPWQRPGWLYGRGACWWLFNPYLQANTPQVPSIDQQTQISPTFPTTLTMPTLTKEQEKQMLEQQLGFIEAHLDAIRKRLEELSK
jgi:hypothetical protein